jgi:hypothetical protein
MIKRGEERNLERPQDATGNWSGPAREGLTILRCLAYQSPLDQGHDGLLCTSYGPEGLCAMEYPIALQGRTPRVEKSTPKVEASEVHWCAE